MLQYRTHADNESMYNTCPTFGIYVMGLVLRWIKGQGGLKVLGARNRTKAEKLYAALDSSRIFKATADRDSRSLMNVTFVTGDASIDEQVVATAKKAGLDGLKGHRSVGGMRASLYNAFPPAGVDALIEVMRDFEAKQG
jgi:phosphoserine aminotransferase